MRLWFAIVNAPPEADTWRVDASGPWGSTYRTGYFPISYPAFIDIGPTGRLSISANPAGVYQYPGAIPGGSAPYSNLQEGVEYNLDFRTGVLSTVEAPPAPPGAPPEEKIPILAMIIPWSPLFGPPLPKAFFPPWPMWMSRWTEIPGYPKIPSLAYGEGALGMPSNSKIPLVFE